MVHDGACGYALTVVRSRAMSDEARCRAIAMELSVLRLDGATVFDTVLPEVRAVLEVENLLVYSPALRLEGWELARYHCIGRYSSAKTKRLFTSFLAEAPPRFTTYDPRRPEVAQRNRVLEPCFEEVARTAYWRAVFVPLGLDRHHQLRVLLCEGASLLAWFGAIHSEPFEPRQRRIVSALVPALRRRLEIERRLDASELNRCALEAATEQIGRPTFIVGARGQLAHANSAGHALLDTRGAEVRCALREAVAGRPSALPFSTIPIADPGGGPAWLAVLHAGSAQDQIARCVDSAARRWQLTPRQRSVLQNVVEGHANATIAAVSNTSERAVELHVTALLDHAGVDSRAALVARVLLS